MAWVKRLSWLTIGLMAFVSVAFCWRQYKIHDKLLVVIFKKRFTEPFETLYLLTKDYTLYKVTSNDEYRITFDLEVLKKRMEKNGHEISDLTLIIHNHLPRTSRKFSPLDIDAWRIFRDEGFTGNFYLYISGFNLIYELRENDDDS